MFDGKSFENGGEIPPEAKDLLDQSGVPNDPEVAAAFLEDTQQPPKKDRATGTKPTLDQTDGDWGDTVTSHEEDIERQSVE